MEKGKLTLDSSTKKKILTTKDGKKIELPKGFINDHLVSSVTDADYILENGILEKIIYNGKSYDRIKPYIPVPQKEKKSNPQGIIDMKKNNNNLEDKFARAPYNFIPLNKVILYPEDQTIDHSKFAGNSGYIDITIENLTPFFIRGKNENFFSINEISAIPGSSLRGMIKNLVQILSYCKFNDFEDSRYYLRTIAECNQFSSRNYYYERMGLSKEGETVSHNAKVGFLNYDKSCNKYYIYESTGEVLQFSKTAAKKDFKKEFELSVEGNFCILYTGQMTKMKKLDDGKDIRIDGKKHWKIENKCDKSKKQEVPDEVIDCYLRDKMRDTKNMDILCLARNRTGADKVFKNGIPVFYTIQENKIESIGHTKNYRIPYQNKVSELIKLDVSERFDFSELMFGAGGFDFSELMFGAGGNNSFSGKLIFEDSYLSKNNKPNFLEEIPKILSSPKPSSFQLYLEQNGRPKSYNVEKKNLQHYDSKDAKIRGYKNYWHRDNNDNTSDNYSWIEKNLKIAGKAINDDIKNKIDKLGHIDYKVNLNPDKTIKDITLLKPYSELSLDTKNLLKEVFYKSKESISSTQSAPIMAISKGTEFEGRIRFDNLSDIELGLLLTALDLPSKCHHKLGMGKPLGLGSVKIVPKLKLIDRKQRYTSFENKEDDINANIDSFKSCFEHYLLNKIDNTKDSLWKIDRLSLLKDMLSVEDKDHESWLEATAYMDFSKEKTKYRQRLVLPNPTEVIELSTAK